MIVNVNKQAKRTANMGNYAQKSNFYIETYSTKNKKPIFA